MQQIISVSDNGCGISSRDIVKFLRPFGTNKRGKSNQIGEKGVGLTFVIFSSDDFEIVTRSEGDCSAKRIAGARAWLENPTATLTLNDVTDRKVDSGTKVTVKVPDDHPLFDLT